MQTPQEVFDAMCPCHGEIWTLTEEHGSVLTTKGKDGSKTRKKELMPLGVFDLLKITSSLHAYRHSLTGQVELLVTVRDKAKLEQEHTKDQLVAEKQRALAELDRRTSDVEDMVTRIKQHIGDALEDVEGVDAHIEAILKSRPQDKHSIN